VDNIDLKAATRKGIVVMNTPGANTISTAEHTFAMLMSLCRSIPQADASIRAGRWERNKIHGVELRGKTLGIIGLGNIGKVLAARARGFDMRVVGYDPYISEEAAAKIGIDLSSIEDLLPVSDFITVHTPLTPETRHLLNAASLKRCKKGVRILNCARGGIVDEAALHEAILEGRVAGAALDVFEKEPPDPANPLLRNDRVIFTPHLGASTEEAQEMVAVLVAEQMTEALLNQGIRNAVNMPSLGEKEMDSLKAFLQLGETLGSLQYQLAEGQMRELRIQYKGDFKDLRTSAITIAIVKGLLSRTTNSVVNQVNAPALAAEKGLQVSETFTPGSGDYVHLISVEYVTSQGEHRVEGSVFGKNDVRIVSVDGFRLNAVAGGHALLYSNDDRPGMIASVSGVLANANVNIASMFLARQKQGGVAMVLINVDSALDQSVLDSVRGLAGVHEVRPIEFS